MMQTARIVSNLSADAITAVGSAVKHADILLTGEGSSRIFPAKKTIYDAHRLGYRERIYTEAATQAVEYDLSGTTVFVASNSGKTREVVRLVRTLKKNGHEAVLGIVANAGTPIIDEADYGYLLTCEKENAVAATKSVVEQALIYDLLFRARNGRNLPDLRRLGDLLGQTMEKTVPPDIAESLAGAGIIYFAGRNNGVAEELALKTNEIARKRSDYLEGTYAVHGIEEVMSLRDVVVVVDPFEQEEEKLSEVLERGVGMKVFAIASRPTRFPTFVIPSMAEFDEYIQLVAGWSLLVETGLRNGIDIDRPERARKIGNEYLDG